MYESFFGLKESPFDLTPNPRFVGLTTKQREALSNLRYGLTSSRGVTLLLGEPGTGKTTLVHTVLAEIDSERIECVLLSHPTLTTTEFYELLADAFALGPDAAVSRARFLTALREHLENRRRLGQLTALVLDEAQSLPNELLEEVRFLSNIETPDCKLLNVVLAGQPQLADRLNEPHLLQLKQRVSLRCELTALTLKETAAYVAGRLRIAGGKPAEIFTQEAVLMIHEVSRGVPRTINVVCDNALVGGFAAQMKPVTRSILQEVVRDFDLGERPASPEADLATTSESAGARETASLTTAPAVTAAPDSPEIPGSPAAGVAHISGRRRRFFGF